MHHCDNRFVISVFALVFLAVFDIWSTVHPSPTSNKDLILLLFLPKLCVHLPRNFENVKWFGRNRGPAGDQVYFHYYYFFWWFGRPVGRNPYHWCSGQAWQGAPLVLWLRAWGACLVLPRKLHCGVPVHSEGICEYTYRRFVRRVAQTQDKKRDKFVY